MTGDGVNDALALKDADIGIAMDSGAAATRAVAQLVLLDNKFSTMPGVVAEGRRVIANIERSANLFVTKTVYAILIALFVALAAWNYPFLPRQLTIISTFTIGIPGFFLAIAPNKQRYVPGFLERVLRFTIPAGIVAGTASLVTYAIAFYGADVPLKQARTATTITLVIVGLWVLMILARPITLWRGVLAASMVLCVAVILAVPAAARLLRVGAPGRRRRRRGARRRARSRGHPRVGLADHPIRRAPSRRGPTRPGHRLTRGRPPRRRPRRQTMLPTRSPMRAVTAIASATADEHAGRGPAHRRAAEARAGRAERAEEHQRDRGDDRDAGVRRARPAWPAPAGHRRAGSSRPRPCPPGTGGAEPRR